MRSITLGTDEHGLKQLAGGPADVGCGAGLLAEPLARLGARVTGLDAAPENIAAAREHALGQGLEIDYRVGGAEALDGRFDLIASLEVVEHVSDPAGFVRGLAGALAQDGLLILSTPNRTAWSKLVMIGIGEVSISRRPTIGTSSSLPTNSARWSGTRGWRSPT